MPNDYQIQVREMLESDLDYFLSYWLNATPEFLESMGVDVSRRPKKDQLIELVSGQIEKPLKQKKNYFLIWLVNNEPVGYSNINKIEYGKQAFMHLHLWETKNRKKGFGSEFVKKSLPFYFNNFDLQFLFCEPYALNLAPNRTVEKIGFRLEKSYQTTPGASNFEQLVNQWKLTKDKYNMID